MVYYLDRLYMPALFQEEPKLLVVRIQVVIRDQIFVQTSHKAAEVILVARDIERCQRLFNGHVTRAYSLEWGDSV